MTILPYYPEKQKKVSQYPHL